MIRETKRLYSKRHAGDNLAGKGMNVFMVKCQGVFVREGAWVRRPNGTP